MHISRNEDEEDNSIPKDSDDMHGFDQCAIPSYKNRLEEATAERTLGSGGCSSKN